VRVRGTYLADRTLLVRNRPLDGVYGYEVLVPLRTAGGLFVVDRGWIPGGETASRPDSVPAPPEGEVEVTARLRPAEPADDRRPPAGQVYRIDLTAIQGLLGEPVYQAYGVLAAESPAPSSAPQALPEPSGDLGPHLSYAVQWVGFALTAYVVLVVAAVRESDRRRAATALARGEPVAARRSRRLEPEDEDW
jgi:cytochrome oxidase assembly protein ShyY1